MFGCTNLNCFVVALLDQLSLLAYLVHHEPREALEGVVSVKAVYDLKYKKPLVKSPEALRTMVTVCG